MLAKRCPLKCFESKVVCLSRFFRKRLKLFNSAVSMQEWWPLSVNTGHITHLPNVRERRQRREWGENYWTEHAKTLRSFHNLITSQSQPVNSPGHIILTISYDDLAPKWDHKAFPAPLKKTNLLWLWPPPKSYQTRPWFSAINCSWPNMERPSHPMHVTDCNNFCLLLQRLRLKFMSVNQVWKLIPFHYMIKSRAYRWISVPDNPNHWSFGLWHILNRLKWKIALVKKGSPFRADTLHPLKRTRDTTTSNMWWIVTCPFAYQHRTRDFNPHLCAAISKRLHRVAYEPLSNVEPNRVWTNGTDFSMGSFTVIQNVTKYRFQLMGPIVPGYGTLSL